MKSAFFIPHVLFICLASTFSLPSFAQPDVTDNFKPAYNVQGLDTQFIDITPEKKVTLVEMKMKGLKDTVVSFRERHPEDLFEFICITKRPFFGKEQHSIACINEMKEVGQKHAFDDKNFGSFMDEPTVINVEPGLKVTKINFDVDIGTEPTFETEKMADSDFPEIYTLVRIDPLTNTWNGNRQFMVKEAAVPVK
jgi:hypothetical protein